MRLRICTWNINSVRLRMDSLGFNQTADYWERLRASEDELQELIEAVVVPETWFFRDQEAFTALARIISKEWLPNHPTAALRLLSGPCCTGEEPYSMVMALLDAGLSRDRLKIDAVDISVRALARGVSEATYARVMRGLKPDMTVFKVMFTAIVTAAPNATPKI